MPLSKSLPYWVNHRSWVNAVCHWPCGYRSTRLVFDMFRFWEGRIQQL